jgi:glycosyltransferase involved in cell wall biosynthesis
MLRIAYLANQFPSPVEPYVGREIEALRRRGVEVVACSVKKGRGEEFDDDAIDPDFLCLRPVSLIVMLQAAWLLLRRWKLTADLLRVARQGHESLPRRFKALLHTLLGACYAVRLRGRDVDHIHVHHGYYGAWIAMTAARLLEIEFSLTLHGSDLLLHHAYLAAKLKHCRFCLTISEYNRRYILQHFAVDPAKVVVSRLGVDVPDQLKEPADWAPKRPFTLVTAGRLHAVKDHALLIRACARLRDRGFDIECVIAGEGPERRRLESLIRQCKLEAQVTLLGHVPAQQMDSLYRRADIVVLTSRSEGIPLVLMEAMACGKIVLAPAITGIPELVLPEKNGFLYQPGSLDDLAARLATIYSLLQRTDHASLHRLAWLRHAARCQILHNFNRAKNLDHFVDRFVELAATHWSPPHADSVLQQIQLPLQRDRGLPVPGHGPDAREGTRGRVVLHGRSAG